MNRGLARWLRQWADEIDHKGAPKATGWTFTFELGEGARFRQDGKGCPLWYLGDEDYRRATEESDTRDQWKPSPLGRRGW